MIASNQVHPMTSRLPPSSPESACGAIDQGPIERLSARVRQETLLPRREGRKGRFPVSERRDEGRRGREPVTR